MLRLRPYKPADAGYLMKWLEDERTVEFWKADRFCWPLTAEQLADYCEDLQRIRLPLPSPHWTAPEIRPATFPSGRSTGPGTGPTWALLS